MLNSPGVEIILDPTGPQSPAPVIPVVPLPESYIPEPVIIPNPTPPTIFVPGPPTMVVAV